jgi:hypothetical protein
VVVGVIGAAVALAAGCGGAGTDVGGVEVAIASALAESLDASDGAVVVTCPEDASLDEGSEVVCDVAVDGAPAPPVPIVVGSGGRATLAAAVLPTGAAEAHLAEVVRAPDGAEVRCGDAPLVVAEVGDTFRCEVTIADQPTRAYDVEVTGLDGEVRPRQVPIGVAAG